MYFKFSQLAGRLNNASQMEVYMPQVRNLAYKIGKLKLMAIKKIYF